MIELLMVIMLVAILGAVALPQFLDFRVEGQVAATQSIVSAVRTGIKLQYSQQIFRCGGASNEWPVISAIASNDITFGGGPCDSLEVSNVAERKLIDAESLPQNPIGGTSGVADCSVGWPTQCSNAASTGGWCYNPSTGAFWAATNVKSECEF